MNPRLSRQHVITGYVLAAVIPISLTALLIPLRTGDARDYVFLYLAGVAIIGITAGTWPALLSSAIGFLLVDYWFVQPLHTLTISDATDLVNLLAFLFTAGVVGSLASRRLIALQKAELLADDLTKANHALEKLNREQAEAATIAVRLATTERQVATLQESDRLRRELLANVSHELRTPLAGLLLGTTSMLERESLPAEFRPSLERIVEQEQRLSRLVSDILDLARIEGSALELSLADIDIEEAARAAAGRLRHRSSRSVDIVNEAAHLEVVADWDRLGQVFDNLLANADRFAPSADPVTILLRKGRKAMAVVEVTDTGPGIADDLKSTAFDRFVTTSSAGAEPGIGLGLAIAKGLVEAQGGKIWIGDGPGGMLCFSIPEAEAEDTPQE